ncbi:MAG: hypothetical protein QOD04_2483, partial [Pseudonocardiales bacterium]|nr:hypothetical protein [Pseudonocardiales bacterium]
MDVVTSVILAESRALELRARAHAGRDLIAAATDGAQQLFRAGD